ARRPVPAAVYVFDDAVDLAVHGGQSAARAVAGAVRWRWHPLWPVLLAAVPAALLLGQAALVAGQGPRTYIAAADGLLVPFRSADAWAVSGHSTDPAPVSPASCASAPRR